MKTTTMKTALFLAFCATTLASAASKIDMIAKPDATWMGIPTHGKMHIPRCDFTNMVSTEIFDEFYLPRCSPRCAT